MSLKKKRKLVSQANSLSSSQLAQYIENDNNAYQWRIYHSNELNQQNRDRIFQLFEMNMKDFYEQSSDGYQRDEKLDELFSQQARYLIVHSSNCLIAFTHFRFEMDFNNQVLYLYEIQIDRDFQRQGLGRWLIEQMKQICRRTQMMKIVLTVYKSNEKAIEFYMKKCLFDFDETNPDDENVDYILLSFVL